MIFGIVCFFTYNNKCCLTFHLGRILGDISTFGIAQLVPQSYVNGFLSLQVPTPGKNHIVCLGFNLGRTRCNKYGIQIRGEDGILDGYGNIAGHGTDPTGNVTDIDALACQVSFKNAITENGIEWHEFNEGTRMLKITGKLNNLRNAKVIFTFHDGTN